MVWFWIKLKETPIQSDLNNEEYYDSHHWKVKKWGICQAGFNQNSSSTYLGFSQFLLHDGGQQQLEL